MTLAWVLPPDTAHAATPRRVLSAKELAALNDANQLLAQAAVRAEQMAQAALDKKIQLENRWRAEARREGRADVQAAVQSVQDQFARLRAEMESALADFATVCVARLLNDLGPHQALAQRASAIARGLINEAPIELSVAPAVARLVQGALREAGLEGQAGLQLREDASLAASDVMAVTASHCVDGRLLPWLRELHASVTLATQSPGGAAP